MWHATQKTAQKNWHPRVYAELGEQKHAKTRKAVDLVSIVVASINKIGYMAMDQYLLIQFLVG